jgi:hypothetical protein
MGTGAESGGGDRRRRELQRQLRGCEELIRDAAAFLAGDSDSLPFDFDERVGRIFNDPFRGMMPLSGPLARLSIGGVVGLKPDRDPEVHEELARTLRQLRARRDALVEVLASPPPIKSSTGATAAGNDLAALLRSRFSGDPTTPFKNLCDVIESVVLKSGRPYSPGFIRKALRKNGVKATARGVYPSEAAIAAYWKEAKNAGTKTPNPPQNNLMQSKAVRTRPA